MTNKDFLFYGLVVGVIAGAFIGVFADKRPHAPTTTPSALVDEYWRGVTVGVTAVFTMQSNISAGVDRVQAKNAALSYLNQQETH